MRVRLSLSILSCILVLVGLTAPLVRAAPAAQWPTSGSYDSPEATMLRTIRSHAANSGPVSSAAQV